MANCIIHVDGSSCPDPITKKNGLGWGLVAEHADQTHEASGAYVAIRNQGVNNAHEDIALLHALEYMRNHTFAPEATSIYCDDDLMGHAPTYLAKENFRSYYAEQIEKRVVRAAQFIGQLHLAPRIMDELSRVVLHKVKGHQGHVYQERVDYLAKWQARKALGNETPQLPFEAWLKKGLVIYMPPGKIAFSGQSALGETPSLVDLGLADPDVTSEPNVSYKPRVRIEYAPFVHALLAPENALQESSPSP